MGDELPNPYLPYFELTERVGDKPQGDIETSALYKEVVEKFDVYHISIKDRSTSYEWYKRYNIDEQWTELLGDHYSISTLDGLPSQIVQIIQNSTNNSTNVDEVSW